MRYPFTLRRARLCFILFFISATAFAQDYPKDFFRMPVDTTVRLAGNFGEIRWDHFHYGWDIRTGNHEGMRVLAAGDGYVSRIKTGPYGYGKVLYITHPNGYVSVYGHLSAFNESIGALVEKEQYAKESYEVELFPQPSELPVKKGEFIAFSGNTGNSSGPHLHFEIRDAKTEEIINPYFFGLPIEDTLKPFMQILAVYPAAPGSIINGAKEPVFISLKGKKGIYQFKGKDSIVVSGKFGLGLQCYDRENNSAGQNQVYSMELQVDDKRIYYYEMNRFAFSDTRYVNCHIDYKEQRRHYRDIQRAFLLPNNNFPAYREVKDRGYLEFNDELVHHGKFIIRDFYGNTSTIDFQIHTKTQQTLKKEKNSSPTPVFKHLEWDKPYNIIMEKIRLEMPGKILYEDLDFTFSMKDTTAPFLSPLFAVQDRYTPLFDYYTLSIKCPSLPDSLKPKLLIVSLDPKGSLVNEGGTFEEGWISTKTRTFGIYSVVLDTAAPKIKAPLVKKKDISKLKNLEFRVSDNLSGIKTYRAELDPQPGQKGKWILFEYEPKKGMIFRKNDDTLPAGPHTLMVSVTDGRGNTSTLLFDYVK